MTQCYIQNLHETNLQYFPTYLPISILMAFIGEDGPILICFLHLCQKTEICGLHALSVTQPTAKDTQVLTEPVAWPYPSLKC